MNSRSYALILTLCLSVLLLASTASAQASNESSRPSWVTAGASGMYTYSLYVGNSTYEWNAHWIIVEAGEDSAVVEWTVVPDVNISLPFWYPTTGQHVWLYDEPTTGGILALSNIYDSVAPPRLYHGGAQILGTKLGDVVCTVYLTNESTKYIELDVDSRTGILVQAIYMDFESKLSLVVRLVDTNVELQKPTSTFSDIIYYGMIGIIVAVVGIAVVDQWRLKRRA